MTKQNPNVHHQIRRAADIALAKRTISRASYDALLAGQISLEQAKQIGRHGAPATDATGGRSGPRTATGARGRTSAEGTDTLQDARPRCLCSCGGIPKGKQSAFLVGHDARLLSELRAQIRKGDVLLRSERITPEQREFAVRHGLIGEGALQSEVLPENHGV